MFLCCFSLRGRRHEWVMDFIAMSVEKMKRHGVQVLQDTYGAPSDGAAASCTDDTDDTDDSHAHMDVEVDTPNNSLSATGEIERFVLNKVDWLLFILMHGL